MSEFTPKMDGIVEAEFERTTGPWREAGAASGRNKVAVVGMVIVLFFVLSRHIWTSYCKRRINEQLQPIGSNRLLPNIGLARMISAGTSCSVLSMEQEYRFLSDFCLSLLRLSSVVS